MKRLWSLFMLLLLAICMNAQNVPVADKIIYKVKIMDTDNPENTNVYDNIDESQRLFFINTLIDAAKSGRIKAYEDEGFTKMLSIEELNKKFVFNDTAYVPDPNNPSNEIMVVVEEEISNDEFTALYFMEQWFFDKNSFKMQKRVVAVAPLLEMLVDSESGGEVVGHKLLFWIKL